eukprot:470510-Prorocentrum_lima.AAC.1
MRTHFGERSTAASLDVEKCSYETIAGSRETHSGKSSGSHHEPEEDDAGFFVAKNDFKQPPGIVPEP